MVDKTGTLDIHIHGQRGSLKLTPESYDVAEILEVLIGIEDILYPGQKKDRPTIAYDLQEGSVRHVFRTGVQAIIAVTAILGQVQSASSIDFLELKTAKAIESLQRISAERDYVIEVRTSLSVGAPLTITPTTKYVRSESTWVEAEFYFYGELTNAGGKAKSNIHLDTREFGSLTLDTPKGVLASGKENILYRHYGVRATGMQNLETGEFDRTSLRFVDFVEHNPTYNEDYLDGLISRAAETWKGVDTTALLDDLRAMDGV